MLAGNPTLRNIPIWIGTLGLVTLLIGIKDCHTAGGGPTFKGGTHASSFGSLNSMHGGGTIEAL